MKLIFLLLPTLVLCATIEQPINLNEEATHHRVDRQIKSPTRKYIEGCKAALSAAGGLILGSGGKFTS